MMNRARYGAVIGWLVLEVGGLQAGATGQELWERLLKGEKPETIEAAVDAWIKEAPDDAEALVVRALLSDRRLLGDPPLEKDRAAWRDWLEAAKAFGAAPEAEAALLEAAYAALETQALDEFEAQRKKLERNRNLPNWAVARHQLISISVLRAQGKFDEAQELCRKLGFVGDWAYLAPFDNAEKQGHNQVFPPESDVRFEGTYPGRTGTVEWRELPVEPPAGYVDLMALVRPAKESSTYLATTISVEKTTRAALFAGHAGAMKVWVNGVLVMDVDRYHEARPDQASCVSELRPGLNLILVKVSVDEAGTGGLFFRAGDAGQGTVLSADGSLETLRKVPKDRLAILSGSTPAFEADPPSTTAMKSMGPSRSKNHIAHILYALLLKRLNVLDRQDVSAYEILSKLREEYPECGIIARLTAGVDLQANRKRVGYRRAVALDTGDLHTRLDELIQARGRPFYEERREWLQEALKLSSDHPRFQAEYARLLMEQGQNGPAMVYVNRALEAAPKMAEYLLLASDLTQKQYDPEIRSQWLERAGVVRRDDPRPYLEQLRIALEGNNLSVAKRFTEQIGEIDPWNLSRFQIPARYHLAAGEFDAAGEAIQAGLRVCPEDAELNRAEAERLDATGAPHEAILVPLQRVLRAEPSDPWALDFAETVSPETDDYYKPYRKDWRELPEASEELVKDANALILLSQQVQRVHPNGNASRTTHLVVKPLTETGVSRFATWPIRYDPGKDDIRILTARVTQPDGTTIDAPPPQHQSIGPSGGAGAAVYRDDRVAVLRIPSIQIGSVVEVEYQIEERGENIFADYFGDVSYMGNFEPTVLEEYILITPAERNFYWKTMPPNYPKDIVDTSKSTIPMEPEEKIQNGERVLIWSASNLPRIPGEDAMPPAVEILPYIKVSTFRTWQDLTTWYWNLIKEQFIPDPMVRQQTEEVLAEYRTENGLGAETELTLQQKVNAINRFVNTKVRYLAISFGIHGWKPYRASDILQSRYGDCKDKATLALTMLEIAGVKADFTIVRTSDLGEIDYELPSLALFNHAIYYVPELGSEGTFIDGTAEYYSELDLPNGDAGVNMLVVERGGASRFQRSPLSAAEENGGIYQTSFELQRDGTARGHRRADYIGLYNPTVRAIYQNKARAAEIIEQQLVAQYPGSECLSYELSDLTTYDNEWIQYDFSIPNFAKVSGSAIDFPCSMFTEEFSSRYTPTASRHFDMVIGESPWSKKNTISIQLPEGAAVQRMPESVTIDTSYGRYQWSAKVEGRALELTEEVAFKLRRVPLDEYQALRDFCRRVDEAQERRITLKVQE